MRDPAPDTADPALDGLRMLGGDPPASPVVISVAHAGRAYPTALLAALRVPAVALTRLEDRYVDRVARTAHRGEALLIQRRGRAWIDLNRSEDERDPAVDEGAAPVRGHTPSAKLRSGLGLVPRRVSGGGELWRRRFSAHEVERRIKEDHRPWHAALAAALERARARFGTAVLLDLHSMPPLGPGAARAVIGDRFGRAAAPRFVARAEATIVAAGWRVALNVPYAGGHALDRHGCPGAGIHAIQLELDRALYLDAAFDQPGAGLAATAAVVASVVAGLADEALAGRRREAAG